MIVRKLEETGTVTHNEWDKLGVYSCPHVSPFPNFRDDHQNEHILNATTVNTQQPRTTTRYGYDNTYASFQGAGMPIFGYDAPANWFTAFNFDPAAGNTSRFRRCTGKERDSESGLDYFGARYYGSALGRFTSPDWSENPTAVPYADPSSPQTLNLYIYGRNNPLSYSDPDGHCEIQSRGGDGTVTTTEGTFWQCVGRFFGGGRTEYELAEQNRSYWASGGLQITHKDGTPLSDSEVNQFQSDHWARIIWAMGGHDTDRPDGPDQGNTPAGGMMGRTGGGSARLTNAQVNDLAKWSGMEPVKDPPFDAHGQKVFRIGNRFFTPDVDGHIGGVWKEFSRQGQRIGTLDVYLNKIGK